MGHHADVQRHITATLALIFLSYLSFGVPFTLRPSAYRVRPNFMAALVHIQSDTACIISSNLLVGRMLRNCHEAFLKITFY